MEIAPTHAIQSRRSSCAGSRLNRSTEREGAAGKASLEAVLGKTRRTEF
jgi:hypothetical protein